VRRAAPATAALLVLALAACDPRAFDDLADQTWVDAQGKPGELASDDYGVGLAFGGSGGQGVRIVAAGRTPAGVARLVYDAAGELETQAELVGETRQVDPLVARPAMAGDPSSFGMATGTVALGTSSEGRAFAMFVDVASANLQMQPLDLRIDGAPLAVAFGDSQAAGAGAGPDFVALTDTAIAIKPDYQTSSTVASCPIAAGTALHLADFDGDGVDEILMARAQAGAEALELVVFGGADLVACDGGRSVFLAGTGRIVAMASGDLDRSGGRDLIVALDGGQVAVAFDLDLAAELPVATVAVGAGAVLAVGDLDGDGGDDLAVGDPTASAAGVSGAGVVRLYRGGGGPLVEAATLHDASPDPAQQYGRALTVGRFGDARDILVVGARDEVFTYFRNPLGGDDVRR
jgi:hypothetical protein